MTSQLLNCSLPNYFEEMESFSNKLKLKLRISGDQDDANRTDDAKDLNIESNLYIEWMKDLLKLTINKLHHVAWQDFDAKFTSDLNYHQIMDYFKDEILSSVIKISVSRSLEYQSSVALKYCKNLEKSRNYLSKSLHESMKKNLDRALVNINKAILLAPFPSENQDEKTNNQLPLCLKTRANIWKEMEKNAASYMDNEDSYKYSMNKTAKVNFGEIKIVHGLKFYNDRNQLKEDYVVSFLTTIDSKNEHIHGAIKELNLSFDEVKGRIIIVGDEIDTKKNSRMIVEEPFCSWLPTYNYSKYCFHCFKSLFKRFFPCQKCIIVRYCSSACAEESWKSYHSIECEYLPILRHFGKGHFILRILMVSGVQEALESFRESLKDGNIGPKPCRSFHNTFSDILSLNSQTHRHYLVNLGFISKFFANLAYSMKMVNEESVLDLSCLMLKLLGILFQNPFSILDSSIESINPDNIQVDFQKGKVIGSGLYAVASLLSHSCLPNCDIIFVHNKIVVNCEQPLKMGEELTISYGPQSFLHDYSSRKFILQKNFAFECICEACIRKE